MTKDRRRQSKLFAIGAAVLVFLEGCSSATGNTTLDDRLPAKLGTTAEQIDVRTTCEEIVYPRDFQGDLVTADGLPRGLTVVVDFCVSAIKRITPNGQRNRRSGYAIATLKSASQASGEPIQVNATVGSLYLETAGPMDWFEHTTLKTGSAQSWTTASGGEAELTDEVDCKKQNKYDKDSRVKSEVELALPEMPTAKPVSSRPTEIFVDDFC